MDVLKDLELRILAQELADAWTEYTVTCRLRMIPPVQWDRGKLPPGYTYNHGREKRVVQAWAVVPRGELHWLCKGSPDEQTLREAWAKVTGNDPDDFMQGIIAEEGNLFLYRDGWVVMLDENNASIQRMTELEKLPKTPVEMTAAYYAAVRQDSDNFEPTYVCEGCEHMATCASAFNEDTLERCPEERK